jgi:nicotinate-nucleotide pyrophosphorylase (carboxylating)
MSGIATLTNQYVRAVAGTGTKILDTRKTIPGMRALDKYSVCCGGGLNHRIDLQDGIAIKGNHIAVGGGLAKVLETATKFRRGKQWVQVEVRNQDELDAAIAGGAESILLDDMTPAGVRKAVKQIRAELPETKVEAGGKVALTNVAEYAKAGVDFVIVDALTAAEAWVDLSMKVAVDVS